MSKKIVKVSLICILLINVLSISGLFLEENQFHSNSLQQLNINTKEEIGKNAMGKLRSSFIENKGQISNEEIYFYGYLPNGIIGFGESEIKLWMDEMNGIITLKFDMARSVLPTCSKKLETKTNYFYGDRGIYTNVRSYKSIIYSNLWEGIDLHYFATPKGAKYEFHVAPGANPEDISVNCDGQEQLIICKESIRILKEKGCFVDEGLKVFQEKTEINAEFIAKRKNTFGFQISKYDKEKTLIIDPLLYSTYIGENEEDSGRKILLDANENIIVIGYTESIKFPTTGLAFNKTYSGLGDCVIIKLTANGQYLLFSTFIGGSNEDQSSDGLIDNDGNIYVTGDTESLDFPTTKNTLNETFNGGYSDSFLFKLAANGSTLFFSTFIGGSELDRKGSIVLDNSNNVWMTGYTQSSDFPTTANAYDQTFNGTGECYVLKLAADGSTLLYSTVVGGNSSEHGDTIAIDLLGNIYVAGITYSNDFPTTIGAFNETYSGDWDGFVFKLSSDGSNLLYSTYVGGERDDYCSALVLDNESNAYVTGYVRSLDFPTTTGAYNDTHSGGTWDSFVFKLSADGSTLLYSTFVGGEDSDYGSDIAIDDEGNAYVTGNTHSGNFPTTTNADDSIMNNWDAFIYKLSSDGSNLLYSSFFGGSETDKGSSIILNNEGHVFVTGRTYSSNFPTTIDAYNETYGGDYDCFISKFLVEDIILPSPTDTETTGIAIRLMIPAIAIFIIFPLIIFNRRKRDKN